MLERAKRSIPEMVALFCGAFMSTMATPSAAQTTHPSGWRFEFSPYVWGANMDGTLRIGTWEKKSSASFSDLLSKLDVGLMGAFEARKGRWGILADSIYMKLSDSGTTPIGRIDGDVTQQMYSLAGAYRVASGTVNVDLLAGARYNKVKLELESASGSRSGSDSMWDPIVGARVHIPLNERWTLVGHGDYGSRAGNSDWQLLAGLNYQFNDRYSGKFGYRHYRLNFEKGALESNTTLAGIYAGLGIRF